MYSPKDIENPKCQSGYDHVQRSATERTPKQWRAQAGASPHFSGEATGRWQGPKRATPLEAAWDYCNYINGLGVQPTQQLKSAGHPSAPRNAPTARQQSQAAAKKKRDLKGFVYLLGEEGDDRYVKIGETEKSDPRYRLRDLQTGNPRKLILLGFIECDDRITTERNLHMKYIRLNHLQEWFRKDPRILQEFPQTQWLGVRR